MINHIKGDPVMVNYWSPYECTVEKNTDGDYTLVDHSIQRSIVSGTRKEIEQFLKEEGFGSDIQYEWPEL